MKQCKFFCTGWWPFLVFPLLLLLLTLLFKWRAIEEDVASNVQSELIAAGYEGIGIETHNRGRDVLLTGDVSSQTILEQVTLGANGVNKVDFIGKEIIPEILPEPTAVVTPPSEPATLNIDYQSDVVVLSGSVGSEAAKQELFSQAVSTFGENNVINNILVSETITDLPNINGLFEAGSKLGDGNKITVEGNSLVLSGEVENIETKESTVSKITALFNGQIIDQLVVVSAEPDPEASTPVTNLQCQSLLSSFLEKQTINFDTAKATIKAGSFPLLDKLVATALRCPDAKFEVSGHTDSSGSLDFNMRLSEARAQSVVNYLTAANLDSQRFTVKGYGPTKPIADNGTPEGRASNRRIEFLVENEGD